MAILKLQDSSTLNIEMMKTPTRKISGIRLSAGKKSLTLHYNRLAAPRTRPEDRFDVQEQLQEVVDAWAPAPGVKIFVQSLTPPIVRIMVL